MKAIYSVALLVCLLGAFYAQAEEVQCPNRGPKPGEDAILIPHPTNCHHYFVCDYGRAIVMKCPDDLHFNPIEKVCDFPWKAGCDPAN
ncbi:PREDICTED: peritrophin-1-like [Wasmannia auropunctata]|uniref:peritrophin-1-like n=1 Tax=Wasmannia auropunctata TaxID=64793 RepID=UPI0005F0A168|nr:PREDICTED: peritrophin-1-like [Wasmannia auropunctata]